MPAPVVSPIVAMLGQTDLPLLDPGGPQRYGGDGVIAVDAFERVPDPLQARGIRHGLVPLLMLAACAVMTRARSFAAIVWGSRTWHMPLTSGDRPSPVVGHDSRRVAAAVIFDLPPGAEAGLAAGTSDVRQGRRTAGATVRGRGAPPYQPETPPGAAVAEVARATRVA